MKKWEITYHPKFPDTPISFWVYTQIDNPIWLRATLFDPPLPKPVPGKGFARLTVHIFNMDIYFASIEEVDHFLNIFSRKNMPTTQQLSRVRTAMYGPNRHWLSRFPAHLKSWKKREKIVELVHVAREALILEMQNT